MIRQYELVERVRAYDPTTDEAALNRAYVFAMKMHGSQTRASGDPYFSHPLEVAGILTGMKLDHGTVITALLHDVIEDTEATLDDVRRLFGDEIARLVDGVTKLTRIELQSDRTKQAENFRKLVLAMSQDIRVLLVKLADRVHNMRTLHFISNPEKRKRIAAETMDIYAPLAARIGINDIKDELEDLAFAEINQDARASIKARLDFLRSEGGDMVERIITALREKLAEGGVTAEVSGRMKTPYSIWQKMRLKEVGIEQLSDIMAFRLVVADIGACYQALGVMHGTYPVVPGRFKDYISTPKPNGYRSLHTGIIGPYRQRIEVQIRTGEMHDIAELGVAAHWNYKQRDAAGEGKQYRWMRELLDILEQASGPEEFLEHTKLEMYQDQVFCFTPKGDLIALPQGAVPIDFAYSVHSEVGDRCVGAKLNGRLVPLMTQLRNGDQVDIITSKTSTPSPNWEQIVVTGKAKARIRRFVRMKRRQQFSDLGKAMLQKAFRQEGHPLAEKLLEPLLGKFHAEAVEDLYAAVGEGLESALEIVHAVHPRIQPVAGKTENVVPISRARGRARKSGQKDALPIKGLIDGMAMHFARCCHPLPGERIVGIVTTGKGVTIHTIDCETLEGFHHEPERWLDVAWDDDDTAAHVGRLDVVIANEPGSLGSLSTVIGKNGGNINNLKIVNRSIDFFEMLIDVEVGDVRHLTTIIAALRATPEINSVDRARG